MNVAAQIAIAVGSIAVLLAVMVAVRHHARKHDLSAEVQRKLVHIGTGLYALTLPWLFADRWPVFMLVALTLVVMGVLRLPAIRSGLGATLHGVERQSWGDILLALAVGTVFLLSQGESILYILPIAVLALADAAAALTGSRYGRGFFQVEEGRKSIEGSVAFFMVTLILSMVCLLLLTQVGRANVIVLSILVAAFGTLVEADSWRGFDNFFLPAGLLVFLQSHMATPMPELIALAVILLTAILGFLAIARHLGLSTHTARVYVVAIFLLLSVTTIENTVLPIMVFVAHAAARIANPGTSAHPELDIVAAVAMISFAWLALGLATGLNALAFYGLTAMGLCLGLIALALAPLSVVWRWIGGAVAAAALVWIHRLLLGTPGDGMIADLTWAGETTSLAMACAAVAIAVPLVRPALFVRIRAARLALLAMALPLGGYLWLAKENTGW
ncbi:hypothetical protein [Oceaniglobus indicus]|uniref:hypothetical protein n=1 Tax=Oceaniglobus indicus TaxID=2047749 RepID=UPI000C19999B|nr:hypothetical protein [Oceaniglobus indicus]